MKIIFVAVCLFIACMALPAQVPVSEMYSFQVEVRDSNYVLHSPQYLSALNPDGYNNQPVFRNDDELLLSVKFADSTQHDIFAFNLLTGKYHPLTRTAVNEFSPGIQPAVGSLSYVRQDIGADTVDQRFLVFENDNVRGTLRTFFPDLLNVGYYSWLDRNNVAFFLTGEPNKLAFADIRTGKISSYVSRIGRCLQSDHSGTLYYIHKYSPDFWYLKRYRAADRSSEIIVQALPGSEDFAIGPDGSFFMGSGSKIYCFRPDKDKSWQEFSDLAPFGIHNISRLAINNHYRLALVNVKE